MTITADANLQILPDVHGRANVAFAYKTGMLNFLTYHRYVGGNGQHELIGEIAPTIVFNSSFQLRPAVAYRVRFHEMDATLIQGTLAGMYYFDLGLDNSSMVFGIGAGVHGLFQPGTGGFDYGVSGEVGVRFIEEIWLGVGGTFGSTGFEGITPTTRSSFFVRVDLLSGSQW